jgi:hypothetical protein
MNIAVSENLDELNRTLALYIRASRKLPSVALARLARDFRFRLSAGLKLIAPGAAKIRAQAFALLKAGVGIRVRESVRRAVMARNQARTDLASRQVVLGKGAKGKTTVQRKGKRLNLRALMVQAEIGVRASGSGFLAQSARFDREIRLGEESRAESRLNQILAEASFVAIRDGAQVTFTWGPFGPLSTSAAKGLTGPKAERAIADALKGATANMLPYIADKFRRPIREVIAELETA